MAGSVPLPRRVYVGRLTEEITAEDVRQYFKKFGEVTDVYMPKDFKAFCFVTFLDPEIAQALCGEDHIIKGSSVYVSDAAPKNNSRKPVTNGRGGDNNNVGHSFKGNNFSNKNDGINGNDRDQGNFNIQGGNRDGPTGYRLFGPADNPAFYAYWLSDRRNDTMSNGENMGGGGRNMDREKPNGNVRTMFNNSNDTSWGRQQN
ncbi:TAR DNA-binding protein 43-like isoform X2 [Diabrotica virgifera virgifera]|uniref:RRM domain-containing protein n=1 Tax=Diabrotica virgifera virgifera TaxID=50390 RepID=A0ABM5KSU9_DIAVI|nr:TAR DNA-binding protein 43-like isoform X2 [Diabrotica virgifera virgifera]